MQNGKWKTLLVSGIIAVIGIIALLVGGLLAGWDIAGWFTSPYAVFSGTIAGLWVMAAVLVFVHDRIRNI